MKMGTYPFKGYVPISYCGKRGLLFGSSGFSSNSAGWHGCGSDGGIGTVGHDGHAFWQLQFGSVDRLADVHFGQVNGQELWQVSWQAGDFDLVGHVADGCALVIGAMKTRFLNSNISVFSGVSNFNSVILTLQLIWTPRYTL